MTRYGTTAGTPAPALTSGMALRRSIAPGCPTFLEPSDDTDNSAMDFSAATPNPRSNSVTPAETPCASTGGGATPPSTQTAAPKKRCKKAKKRAAAAKNCKKSGSSYAPACWSFRSRPLTPSEPSTLTRFRVYISFLEASPSSVVVAPR